MSNSYQVGGDDEIFIRSFSFVDHHGCWCWNLQWKVFKVFLICRLSWNGRMSNGSSPEARFEKATSKNWIQIDVEKIALNSFDFTSSTTRTLSNIFKSQSPFQLWISYFEDGSTVPPPFNMIPSPKALLKVLLCRFLENARSVQKDRIIIINQKSWEKRTKRGGAESCDWALQQCHEIHH